MKREIFVDVVAFLYVFVIGGLGSMYLIHLLSDKAWYIQAFWVAGWMSHVVIVSRTLAVLSYIGHIILVGSLAAYREANQETSVDVQENAEDH